MTQAFIEQKGRFFPTVSIKMIRQDIGSEGAMALVVDAIASYHGGVAVVWNKDNPKNWEVYAPTSCDLTTHCRESARTVWGFRKEPYKLPEFGRYDYDTEKGALERVVPIMNTHEGQLASRFAESFSTAAKKAHEAQQVLATLSGFCAEYIVHPEQWSVDDSVITFMHPQFTLQTDYRQVIPIGSQELGVDKGMSIASLPDVFMHFYDIKPVGTKGVSTLDEAMGLFTS